MDTVSLNKVAAHRCKEMWWIVDGGEIGLQRSFLRKIMNQS